VDRGERLFAQGEDQLGEEGLGGVEDHLRRLTFLGDVTKTLGGIIAELLPTEDMWGKAICLKQKQ